MNGRASGSVVDQRALVVQVMSSLKLVSRVDKVVFGKLATISQGTEYKSWDVMLQLYRTSVRPHLDYCGLFWLPHYRKNMPLNWKECRDYLQGCCQESLGRLGLYFLECRRLRGNVMECIKSKGQK